MNLKQHCPFTESLAPVSLIDLSAELVPEVQSCCSNTNTVNMYSIKKSFKVEEKRTNNYLPSDYWAYNSDLMTDRATHR